MIVLSWKELLGLRCRQGGRGRECSRRKKKKKGQWKVQKTKHKVLEEEEEEERRRRRRRRSGEIRGGWRRGDPSVMEVRVFPPADSMTFQEIYMCDNILIENKRSPRKINTALWKTLLFTSSGPDMWTIWKKTCNSWSQNCPTAANCHCNLQTGLWRLILMCGGGLRTCAASSDANTSLWVYQTAAADRKKSQLFWSFWPHHSFYMLLSSHRTVILRTSFHSFTRQQQFPRSKASKQARGR